MEQAKIQYVKKKKLNVTTSENNTKTMNYDDVTKEIINEHNPNWQQIPDH